jgi:hypothetical protein
MEEIRSAARGVLFGTHAGDSLRILRWRPIVSEDDTREFVRLLLVAKQDPELRSLQPVGWFVSHPHDIALTASDQEIFDQYFSEPWQVTLVLSEATRAGVVVRSGGSCQAFVLDPPERAKAKLLRLLWAIPTLIAMILAGALIRPQHPAPVHPGMFLRIQGEGPALQINWDATAVRGAKSGDMEVQDGGRRSVFHLAGPQLSAGTMTWQLQSGDVQVRMTVHPAGGGEVREFARYRLATLRPPAPSPAQDPHADELKKLSEELHQERVRSEKLRNMVKILENRLEIDTSRGK